MTGTGPATQALLPIGRISAEAGVSTRTLRYYEELGLLTPARHTVGGARRYGPEAVARVRRIRELQSLMGSNLEEIREFLSAEDRLLSLRAEFRGGAQPARQEDIAREALAIIDGLRAQVRAKQSALTELEAELDARAARARRRLSSARTSRDRARTPDPAPTEPAAAATPGA